MATGSVIQPCPLVNLGAIGVLVIDEEDQPVPKVVVVLSDGSQEVSTRTGPNAHVCFAGLVPGSYASTVPEWDQAACIETGTRELSTARKKGGANVPGSRP